MVTNNKKLNKSYYKGHMGIDVAKYNLYFKFEEQYKKLLNAYHNTFAEAQSDPVLSGKWPEIYKTYSDKLNMAMTNWIQFGYKKEIESRKHEEDKMWHAPTCIPWQIASLKPEPAIAV